MEELSRAGKTRAIGVSNVSLDQLRLLFAFAEIKPAFVQNRCFARDGWDREVRRFAREHGIVYQAFSLLTANQRELSAPAISRIQRETGRSVPELVFRFAIQAGMLPLTGTSQLEHMRSDLGCLEFELAAKHQEALERLAS
jgi:diketogulonate reductase-like aldo/keto reductase